MGLKFHLKTYLVAVSLAYQLSPDKVGSDITNIDPGVPRELASTLVNLAANISEANDPSLSEYVDLDTTKYNITYGQMNGYRQSIAKELNFDFIFAVSYDYHGEFHGDMVYEEWQIIKGILFAITLPAFRKQHILLAHDEYLAAVMFGLTYSRAVGTRRVINYLDILEPYLKYSQSIIEALHQVLSLASLAAYWEYIAKTGIQPVLDIIEEHRELFSE